MDNPVLAKLSLRRLCNQFVHSFVFIIQLEQNSTIRGFYVVSDDFRKKSLYFVALTDVLKVLGTDKLSPFSRLPENHALFDDARHAVVVSGAISFDP